MFECLRKKLTHTPAYAHFLSLLQHALLLPRKLQLFHHFLHGIPSVPFIQFIPFHFRWHWKAVGCPRNWKDSMKDCAATVQLLTRFCLFVCFICKKQSITDRIRTIGSCSIGLCSSWCSRAKPTKTLTSNRSTSTSKRSSNCNSFQFSSLDSVVQVRYTYHSKLT